MLIDAVEKILTIQETFGTHFTWRKERRLFWSFDPLIIALQEAVNLNLYSNLQMNAHVWVQVHGQWASSVSSAPTFSVLTTLALNATRQVLIPMVADPFGVHGTKLMKHVLDEHEHDYGVKVNILGVIFTLWKTHMPVYAQNAELIIEHGWRAYSSVYIFNSRISNDDNYKIINGKNFDGANGNIDLMKSGLHQSKKNEFKKFVDEFLSKI